LDRGGRLLSIGRLATIGPTMRAFGKILQFIGMTILPLAIVLELVGPFGTKEMLIALGFGLAAFYLGRTIEGYSAR